MLFWGGGGVIKLAYMPWSVTGKSHSTPGLYIFGINLCNLASLALIYNSAYVRELYSNRAFSKVSVYMVSQFLSATVHQKTKKK